MNTPEQLLQEILNSVVPEEEKGNELDLYTPRTAFNYCRGKTKKNIASLNLPALIEKLQKALQE